MNQQTYIVKFDGLSAADANRYAIELRNALLDASQEVKVNQRRDDPRTLDFGATLVLILGTPAILAVATAVGDWLKLRNSASLTFETPDGQVIAQNITSRDAARLTEILLTNK